MKQIILCIALGLVACVSHSRHRSADVGIDIVPEGDGLELTSGDAAVAASASAQRRGVAGRNSALIWVAGREEASAPEARTPERATVGARSAAATVGVAERRSVSSEAPPVKPLEKRSERGDSLKPAVEGKKGADGPDWMQFVTKPGSGAKASDPSAIPKAAVETSASGGGGNAKGGKAKGAKTPSKVPAKKSGPKAEPAKGDRINEMQSSATERVLEMRPVVGTDAEVKLR